ncbi:DRC7, partial [Symbiodinium sp. CCMP2456]
AMEWSEAAVKERTPPTRKHHAAVYLPEQQKMLVFGGFRGFGGYFNDLWSLDVK